MRGLVRISAGKAKISLTKGYFGQFKGCIFCSPGSFLLSFTSWGLWVTGLYNRSNSSPS